MSFSFHYSLPHTHLTLISFISCSPGSEPMSLRPIPLVIEELQSEHTLLVVEDQINTELLDCSQTELWICSRMKSNKIFVWPIYSGWVYCRGQFISHTNLLWLVLVENASHIISIFKNSAIHRFIGVCATLSIYFISLFYQDSWFNQHHICQGTISVWHMWL